MEIEVRKAALCLIQRQDSFLVAEITDPHTGAVYHRPPGGGLEHGESPEDAVRREIREELGIELTTLKCIGAIDHTWFWKGREVREQAWLFQADSSDDARLSRGETPELAKVNGKRYQTHWRPVREAGGWPPLCPARLLEFVTGSSA